MFVQDAWVVQQFIDSPFHVQNEEFCMRVFFLDETAEGFYVLVEEG